MVPSIKDEGLRMEDRSCGTCPETLIYPLPSANRSLIVIHLLYVLFAGIGATLILGALTYVSLLIGGLVNGMIVLLSGPIIDKMIEKRKARARAA
jgi:hypothetical protein